LGLDFEPNGLENHVRIACFKVTGDNSIEFFLSGLSGRQVDIDEPRQHDFLSKSKGDGKIWHVITIV
jgi:hypothetical protein